MKRIKETDKEKLDRLVDSVIDDIQEMSDEEVLQLALETFGGIKPVITKFNFIVEQAEGVARKRRFDAAKEKVKVTRESSRLVSIVNLPIERKKSILAMAQRNGTITTLAARSATDSEADIDTLLEDLVEFGVIDENGNPR